MRRVIANIVSMDICIGIFVYSVNIKSGFWFN